MSIDIDCNQCHADLETGNDIFCQNCIQVECYNCGTVDRQDKTNFYCEECYTENCGYCHSCIECKTETNEGKFICPKCFEEYKIIMTAVEVVMKKLKEKDKKRGGK